MPFLLSECSAGFVPDAINTVNGSPALRAPTLTFTSASPAPTSKFFSASGVNPEPAIAEAFAHPRFVVLSQVEDEDAAARHDESGLLRRARRTGPRHDAAPGTAAPRRRSRSPSAAFSSVPRFHVTLVTRRLVASARARFNTSADRSTAMTLEAQRLVSTVR